MKRIFLDTNVVIDFLGEREKFIDDAISIMCMAEKGEIEILCSSLTFSNAAYILRHGFTLEEIKTKLSLFSQISTVTTVDDKVVKLALKSSFKDLEDAMQYYSALEAGADYIVTRNVKDFVENSIMPLSPQDFLAIMAKR